SRGWRRDARAPGSGASRPERPWRVRTMADEKKAKGEGAKAKGEGAKPKAEGAKPKPEAKDVKKAAKPAKDAPQAGATQSGRPRAPKEKPRLATFYHESVCPALIEKFKYTSPMQAPRFEKIVINMGVGDAIADQKLLEGAVVELTQI